MTTTSHETLTFRTLAAHATGEFADNMTYPASVQVTMTQADWEATHAMLMALPETMISIDLRLPAQDSFLDAEGLETDPDDYDDCPQFHCYRFVRHSAERFAFYLVLAAKYHDTFVKYELTQETA
jgi:hypothetical protein